MRKQPSDLTHFGIGELGVSVPLSTSQSSVADLISHVLDVSSPRKILDVVIGGVPIQVPGLHPIRTRSHECLKHESVNVHGSAVSSYE